jgi:hypothetical protein
MSVEAAAIIMIPEMSQALADHIGQENPKTTISHPKIS